MFSYYNLTFLWRSSGLGGLVPILASLRGSYNKWIEDGNHQVAKNAQKYFKFLTILSCHTKKNKTDQLITYLGGVDPQNIQNKEKNNER